MRSRSLALMILLGLGVMLTGFGMMPEPRSSQQFHARQNLTSGALRIGLVNSLSGALAGAGADLGQGVDLWLAQNDRTIGGRPVDLIVEDDQGNSEIGVQVAKRLVEKDQVDILVGPIPGNVGVALGQFVRTVDIPLVYPIPTSDVFVHDSYPNVFPLTGTAPQFNGAMGTYALSEGFDRIATLCSDYAFGQQVCGGFVTAYTDGGGEVSQQVWAPLNSSDYAPYISRLRASGADAVFTGLVGADAVKFIRAWKEFGMDDEMKLLGSDPSFDQAVLRGIGEDSSGLVSVGHFAEGRMEQATMDFTTAYQQRFDGKIPGYYSASGYLAMDWIDRALTSRGGAVGGAADFVNSMGDIQYEDSVFGPISVDGRGQPVFTVYLRRVVPTSGGYYWNTVIGEYPDIGATGPLTYEEYLSRPVYSRSYQGFSGGRR